MCCGINGESDYKQANLTTPLSCQDIETHIVFKKVSKHSFAKFNVLEF